MYSIENIISAIPQSTVLSLTFYIALGIYAVFTAILYFHWNSYSVEPVVNKITAIVYLFTTIPLIIIMSIVMLII